MKTRSWKQALFAVAAVSCALVLAGSTAFAQVRPWQQNVPSAGPTCGSVAALMHYELFPEGIGALGDNFVGLPIISPLNNTPTNPASNGFTKLCSLFGLTGTASALIQFNAQSGIVTTHLCNAGAAPVFNPGEGVLIRPTGVATPISGVIPGVECSAPYRLYAEGSGPVGDNLYSPPLTVTSNSPVSLCTAMGWPAATAVIRVNAGPGTIETHSCGAGSGFPAGFKLGEALLVRPPAPCNNLACTSVACSPSPTCIGQPVIF